ncbi:GSU3473 family protein [Geomonas azotofigens]|uniref:GSU3473 family protein n=1 Tax=Geomonas azotofigens TaxID=2843196 RepID=UPI001F341262|nr:hypothetical protein [Geomonas azotofigens]
MKREVGVEFDFFGQTGKYIETENGMGITVIFHNGDEKKVPSYMLDYLIRENKIVAFQRSSGWVQIGRDPIRKSQQPLTRAGERWSDFLFKRKQA